MTDDLYQEIILEEFKHPQNVGVLKNPSAQYHERNASCGDDLTAYIQIDEQQRIQDIKWQGTGCAISIASMSVLSSHLKNKQLSATEIHQLAKSDLEKMVGLTSIAYGREKCLLLGLRAIQHALQDARLS